MRLAICCISILLTSATLVGCGQTGALQLPNDPNYDKRAQYLIYSEKQTEDQATEVKKTPVQQPSSSQNQTTTP